MTEQAEANQKSIERLYDYTKFHIGVYLTFGAGALTLATGKLEGSLQFQVNGVAAGFGVFFFSLAGMFGGMILSALTRSSYCVGSEEFLEMPWPMKASDRKKAGKPGKFDGLNMRQLSIWEHLTFWLGALLMAVAFIL